MAEKTRRLTGLLTLTEIGLVLKLGVHEFERLETRKVPVDISRRGVLMENGEPSVDYSLVCSLLFSELSPEYLYIEDLAGDILDLLDSRWPGGWTVTVHKLQPPTELPLRAASVTVES